MNNDFLKAQVDLATMIDPYIPIWRSDLKARLRLNELNDRDDDAAHDRDELRALDQITQACAILLSVKGREEAFPATVNLSRLYLSNQKLICQESGWFLQHANRTITELSGVGQLLAEALYRRHVERDGPFAGHPSFAEQVMPHINVWRSLSEEGSKSVDPIKREYHRQDLAVLSGIEACCERIASSTPNASISFSDVGDQGKPSHSTLRIELIKPSFKAVLTCSRRGTWTLERGDPDGADSRSPLLPVDAQLADEVIELAGFGLAASARSPACDGNQDATPAP